MNLCINPKAKQWLWFAALWLGGFAVMLGISGLFKLLFHFLR